MLEFLNECYSMQSWIFTRKLHTEFLLFVAGLIINNFSVFASFKRVQYLKIILLT